MQRKCTHNPDQDCKIRVLSSSTVAVLCSRTSVIQIHFTPLKSKRQLFLVYTSLYEESGSGVKEGKILSSLSETFVYTSRQITKSLKNASYRNGIQGYKMLESKKSKRISSESTKRKSLYFMHAVTL